VGGAPRIHGELLKHGYEIAESTVSSDCVAATEPIEHLQGRLSSDARKRLFAKIEEHDQQLRIGSRRPATRWWGHNRP